MYKLLLYSFFALLCLGHNPLSASSAQQLSAQSYVPSHLTQLKIATIAGSIGLLGAWYIHRTVTKRSAQRLAKIQQTFAAFNSEMQQRATHHQRIRIHEKIKDEITTIEELEHIIDTFPDRAYISNNLSLLRELITSRIPILIQGEVEKIMAKPSNSPSFTDEVCSIHHKFSQVLAQFTYKSADQPVILSHRASSHFSWSQPERSAQHFVRRETYRALGVNYKELGILLCQACQPNVVKLIAQLAPLVQVIVVFPLCKTMTVPVIRQHKTDIDKIVEDLPHAFKAFQDLLHETNSHKAAYSWFYHLWPKYRESLQKAQTFLNKELADRTEIAHEDQYEDLLRKKLNQLRKDAEKEEKTRAGTLSNHIVDIEGAIITFRKTLSSFSKLDWRTWGQVLCKNSAAENQTESFITVRLRERREEDAFYYYFTKADIAEELSKAFPDYGGSYSLTRATLHYDEHDQRTVRELAPPSTAHNINTHDGGDSFPITYNYYTGDADTVVVYYESSKPTT